MNSALSVGFKSSSAPSSQLASCFSKACEGQPALAGEIARIINKIHEIANKFFSEVDSSDEPNCIHEFKSEIDALQKVIEKIKIVSSQLTDLKKINEMISFSEEVQKETQSIQTAFLRTQQLDLTCKGCEEVHQALIRFSKQNAALHALLDKKKHEWKGIFPRLLGIGTLINLLFKQFAIFFLGWNQRTQKKMKEHYKELKRDWVGLSQKVTDSPKDIEDCLSKTAILKLKIPYLETEKANQLLQTVERFEKDLYSKYRSIKSEEVKQVAADVMRNAIVAPVEPITLPASNLPREEHEEKKEDCSSPLLFGRETLSENPETNNDLSEEPNKSESIEEFQDLNKKIIPPHIRVAEPPFEKRAPLSLEVSEALVVFLQDSLINDQKWKVFEEKIDGLNKKKRKQLIKEILRYHQPLTRNSRWSELSRSILLDLFLPCKMAISFVYTLGLNTKSLDDLYDYCEKTLIALSSEERDNFAQTIFKLVEAFVEDGINVTSKRPNLRNAFAELYQRQNRYLRGIRDATDISTFDLPESLELIPWVSRNGDFNLMKLIERDDGAWLKNRKQEFADLFAKVELYWTPRHEAIAKQLLKLGILTKSQLNENPSRLMYRIASKVEKLRQNFECLNEIKELIRTNRKAAAEIFPRDLFSMSISTLVELVNEGLWTHEYSEAQLFGLLKSTYPSTDEIAQLEAAFAKGKAAVEEWEAAFQKSSAVVEVPLEGAEISGFSIASIKEELPRELDGGEFKGIICPINRDIKEITSEILAQEGLKLALAAIEVEARESNLENSYTQALLDLNRFNSKVYNEMQPFYFKTYSRFVNPLISHCQYFLITFFDQEKISLFDPWEKQITAIKTILPTTEQPIPFASYKIHIDGREVTALHLGPPVNTEWSLVDAYFRGFLSFKCLNQLGGHFYANYRKYMPPLDFLPHRKVEKVPAAEKIIADFSDCNSSDFSFPLKETVCQLNFFDSYKILGDKLEIDLDPTSWSYFKDTFNESLKDLSVRGVKLRDVVAVKEMPQEVLKDTLEILGFNESSLKGTKISWFDKVMITELFYALLTIKLIAASEVTSFNLTLTQETDDNGKHSILFYVLLMLSGETENEEKLKDHRIMTYAPALMGHPALTAESYSTFAVAMSGLRPEDKDRRQTLNDRLKLLGEKYKITQGPKLVEIAD